MSVASFLSTNCIDAFGIVGTSPPFSEDKFFPLHGRLKFSKNFFTPKNIFFLKLLYEVRRHQPTEKKQNANQNQLENRCTTATKHKARKLSRALSLITTSERRNRTTQKNSTQCVQHKLPSCLDTKNKNENSC